MIALGTWRKYIPLTAASCLGLATAQQAPAPSLIVDPAPGIRASGPPGGPFSPSTFQYRLRSSVGTVKYSISTPSWLSASSAIGTADVSGVTITLSVNPTAGRLEPGTYGPAVAFANVTNGRGTTVKPSVLVVGGSGLPRDRATPNASALPPANLPTSPQHRFVPPASGSHTSAPRNPASSGYVLDQQGGYLLDFSGQRILAR